MTNHAAVLLSLGAIMCGAVLLMCFGKSKAFRWWGFVLITANCALIVGNMR